MSQDEDGPQAQGTDGENEPTTERVAAILAADAVGYSRLMADDEKATIAALDRARTVFSRQIEANRGRVVDMAGDSVLAIFETTAGAVEAAVAVQRTLAEDASQIAETRRMRFRVGVHLGDIHEKRDGTIYGDGVNIAARLEGLAKPGTVVVSDAVRAALRGRAAFQFADLGRFKVKNIADAVRAHSVVLPGQSPTRSRIGLAYWVRVASIPLALGLVIALILVWPGIHGLQLKQTIHERPVIAILPFDDLSGEADQEIFVDGLTDEIIEALSRFPHLAVIARNSAFRYKGRTIDIHAIGDELGARYLVEGNVRRAGEAVRIHARLIDVESEQQIWSETFERALSAENVFAIQDEVTAQIASRIGDMQGAIGTASVDALRREAPARLASFDCVLLAIEYKRNLSDALLKSARACLEATVESDPDYALAWSWLCEIYLDEYRRGIDPDPDLVDNALAAGIKAVQLAPNDGRAYYAQANAHYYSDNFDAFERAAERALELNPYSAHALYQLGHRYAYAGKWEKGRSLVDKAIALQPFYKTRGNFVAYFYYYHRGEYETALEYALDMNLPDYVWAIATLAAAYGQLNRHADAASAVARMIELRPNIADTARADRWKFFRYQPSLLDHFMEGLRKAGLDVPPP